jgi:hypothetical protein
VAREFFRIVHGSSPTLDDFKPLGATGRILRFPEYRREFEEGISVYDDFVHACNMARRNRFRQGRYVVKIVVPDDSSLEVNQTFAEHHFTIYGKPDQILPYASPVAVPIPDALGD